MSINLLWLLLFSAPLTGIIILNVVCMWKLYKLAGKPAWASLIPLYRFVVMLQIIDKPIFWIVLFNVPILNLYVYCCMWVEFAAVFGKSKAFGVGLIILPLIFIPILALDNPEYIGAI